jgi:hypothetical protein
MIVFQALSELPTIPNNQIIVPSYYDVFLLYREFVLKRVQQRLFDE